MNKIHKNTYLSYTLLDSSTIKNGRVSSGDLKRLLFFSYDRFSGIQDEYARLMESPLITTFETALEKVEDNLFALRPRSKEHAHLKKLRERISDMEDPEKRSCKFLHICNIDTQNQVKPLRAKRNLKSVKNGPILKISEIHISARYWHADMPVSYEKNSVQNAGITRKNHEVTLVGELTGYITYGLRLLMVNTFSFSYIKVSRKWPPSTSWSQKSSFPKISIKEVNFDDEFVVLSEGVEICQCSEFLDAVAVVLATYYVFNIELPPKFGSTLRFIGQKLLGINPDSQKKDTKIAKLCVALGMDK